ncbi:hypothetical protein [Cutibacterium avidum]|uniref:Head-to-tail adaptor n=1 Tax=Cutibacterium avidum TaxID=33010 RepID=A0A3E2DMA9_9ACTN|nr:hypothetical protein [Cutibacterium avidum]RFT46517.1 hypothetical protein CHT91_02960 [Cutibacterium avidum]TMT54749.1 hypothetical protein DMY01_03020 [Cutibacterium avidum]
MGTILTNDDLAPFASIDDARAEAMIADVEAVAIQVAPCIAKPDFVHLGAAKAILRRAVLRWNETGVSGSVSSQSAGPFSETVTTRTSQELLWPSEVAALQRLCRDAGSGRAFTINPTAGYGPGVHSDVCSTVWGDGCSCGSDINAYRGPLWEV